MNYVEIKEKLDKHEIDITSLSIEDVEVLCNMYEKQIRDLDNQIKDVKFQIDRNKNNIRKALDEMREINSSRNLYSNNQESSQE